MKDSADRNSYFQFIPSALSFADAKPFIFMLCGGALAGLLLSPNAPISRSLDSATAENPDFTQQTNSNQIDESHHDNASFSNTGGRNTSAAISSSENTTHVSIDIKTKDVCPRQCRLARSLIGQVINASDEKAQAVMANTTRFTKALRDNAYLRSGLLQIAPALSPAQRKLLITAFYGLDAEHRRSLGIILDDSTDSLQRLDGIQLMASADVLNPAIVRRVSGRLLNEPDAHVREALVRALNKPTQLKGHPDVLQTLAQLQSIEQNDDIRGQLLLAQANLSTHPETFIDESIDAIRSNREQYAADGTLALENILVQISLNQVSMGSETTLAINQLMNDLMEADSMTIIPDELRRSLDNLYTRFF